MPLIIEQQFMETVIRELPKISKSLDAIQKDVQKPVDHVDDTLAMRYWSEEIKFQATEKGIALSDADVADIVGKILFHDDILWDRINERIAYYMEEKR